MKKHQFTLNWYHLWIENPSQWTILEPLCYSSFVFATLVHGVIGYKFCWLLPQSRSTSWTWISWYTNWAWIKQVAQKNLKILQNVPGRVRNPWKKAVRNSKLGKRRYDQNNYQQSVFYTGWLDEPAKLAEPDSNWSNRLQKILKIWQNVPGRVRNPWKKRCAIPSLNEGAMIKTSPSAPNLNMPL